MAGNSNGVYAHNTSVGGVIMVHEDTISLLRECSAGIKMGTASIDEVLESVEDKKLKEILS